MCREFFQPPQRVPAPDATTKAASEVTIMATRAMRRFGIHFMGIPFLDGEICPWTEPRAERDNGYRNLMIHPPVG